MPSCRLLSIAILFSLGIAYYISCVNIPVVPPIQIVQQNRNVSAEKYVTLFAPSSPHPWDEGKVDHYFESVTIIAHQLLHNPYTKDPLNREFLVLATDSVKPKQVSILQQLGAQVRVVPSLAPPSNVDLGRMNHRWKDQFTKLLLWNMTEYRRIVYIDADSLVIKPISELFDLQPQRKDSEDWLFASVYDAAPIKGFGTFPDPLPTLGPDDKWGWHEFSGGQFVLMPTQAQSDYVFSMYYNPPDVDFTPTMEQSFLRYAYRDEGPFPWIRLSQIYNTQYPRAVDIPASKILHEKSWKGGPNNVQELQDEWHRGWGEVQGYLSRKQGLEEYAKEAHPITKG